MLTEGQMLRRHLIFDLSVGLGMFKSCLRKALQLFKNLVENSTSWARNYEIGERLD